MVQMPATAPTDPTMANANKPLVNRFDRGDLATVGGDGGGGGCGIDAGIGGAKVMSHGLHMDP